MKTARGKVLITLAADTKKLRKDLGSARKQFKGFQNQLGSLKSALIGAFAVVGIKNLASETIKLADIQAKAQASLLTALQGNVKAQQELIGQAKELQKTTLFGDEATIQAAAMLASMGLQKDEIKKLIPLVQDFATLQKLDLATAAGLVAKSVGSSTNALTRYGIQIQGAVGSSERLESAVKAMNEKVGGQAAAAAKVGAASFQQFANLLGDMKENIGILLITALNPMTQGFGDVVASVSEFLEIPLSKKLIQEKENLNVLVRAIIQTNKSQEIRNKLVNELQKEYPDFLKNLNTETLTNAKLRDRLKEVNEQLEKKIINQIAGEKEEKLLRKIAESLFKQAELRKDIAKEGDGSLGQAGAAGISALSSLELSLSSQQVLTKKWRAELEQLRDTYRGLLSDTESSGGVAVTTAGNEQIRRIIEDVKELEGKGLSLFLNKLPSALDTSGEAFSRLKDFVVEYKDQLEEARIGFEKMQELQEVMASKVIAANIAQAGSFEELGKAIIRTIADIIKAMIAQAVIVQALKVLKLLPPPFNLIAAGAAGAAAGIAFTKLLKGFNVPGFAEGGTNISAGLAVVGERGPEVVQLPGGSSVIPNNKLGGEIHIHFEGAFVGDRQQLGQAITEILNRHGNNKSG